ncbi:MAG: 4-phosphoerythronate dehydrogenase [Pseudomonadota bacterium]
MRIVADDNMPGVEACCALLDAEVEVVRRPGRTLTAADVASADMLLVRSITRVDAALLAGSRVRFVGTATIGTDHLDLPWLDAQGIAWASAPGCNARAVGEWVLNVLVQLAAEQGVTLAGRTLGIIGLGYVGRWVARLTRLLGIRVVACDPFLSAADLPADLADIELLSLTALLDTADMVSIHTPLTRSGAHPTQHLLAAPELARLRPDAWLINAARGPVIANAALLQVLTERVDSRFTAVLDVWEHEPLVDPQLLQCVRYGSPHIAGHSLEGKWRGTWQIIEAASRHLGLTLSGTLADILPSEGGQVLQLPATTTPLEVRLAALLQPVIPLAADDARLRASLYAAAPAQAFDQLRKHYPVRREFPAHQVLMAADDPQRQLFIALGFSC